MMLIKFMFLLMIMSLTYLIGFTQGSNHMEELMLKYDGRCKK